MLMSMRTVVAITLVLLLVASPTCVATTTKTYKPISTLETEAYLGRWYQMAASAQFVLLELGGNCVTADYTLNDEDDGKIALVNQARPWLIPKWLARTTGYVVQSNVPTEQGAFTVDQTYLVSIDPDTVEYEAPGNYWIIGLGPLINGKYQWAAVSTSNKSSSFILARDVKEYNKLYKSAAKKVFEDFGGFDNKLTNKPIDTPHVLCFGYKNAIFT